jgi:TolA-binding protein
MTSTRRISIAIFLFATSLTLPAHAVSKEMVQLMAQVQDLQNAVARLQQSNDERMGVLKDLVQQTADSVNRMSVSVGSLEQKLAVQHDASTAKTDQVSGQIQSLNDSLDELKARMAKLDRVLGNIESQQQQTTALLQNLPTANPGATPPATVPAPSQPQQEMPDTKSAIAPGKNAPPQAGGASPAALYRVALGDYMAAKYPLAASEFADLIKQYPDDDLSGNAYFYLGELNAKSLKPSIAVKDYDHLLEHYPDNAKIPAAHLHKGEALISMKEPDAGIRELRALIQRFPNSPEATQARAKLTAMSISIAPKH